MIVGILILAFILSFVFVLLTRKRERPNSDTTPNKFPQEITKPNSSQTASGTKQNIPLIITNTSPIANSKEEYLPITTVEFTFSEPVDPRVFRFQIDPYVQTYLRTKGNTVLISPENIWKPGVTKIIILKDTISTFGNKLASDFEYAFTTNFPKEPPDDDHGY